MNKKRSKERNKKYEARRAKVHLPAGTDIKRWVNVESERTGKPKWRVLQDLYLFYQKNRPQTPEERIVALYEEFIKGACTVIPGHEFDLLFLKKHILRRIFKLKNEGMEDPDDNYYEQLKNSTHP
ncbi:MAG: hypothetical protein FIB08_07675 [Candidatus Methanoperedens sp.]|nr:hypothetical protein [Candidatus Methanoperedens sp.]